MKTIFQVCKELKVVNERSINNENWLIPPPFPHHLFNKMMIGMSKNIDKYNMELRIVCIKRLLENTPLLFNFVVVVFLVKRFSSTFNIVLDSNSTSAFLVLES